MGLGEHWCGACMKMCPIHHMACEDCGGTLAGQTAEDRKKALSLTDRWRLILDSGNVIVEPDPFVRRASNIDTLRWVEGAIRHYGILVRQVLEPGVDVFGSLEVALMSACEEAKAVARPETDAWRFTVVDGGVRDCAEPLYVGEAYSCTPYDSSVPHGRTTRDAAAAWLNYCDTEWTEILEPGVLSRVEMLSEISKALDTDEERCGNVGANTRAAIEKLLLAEKTRRG